MLRNYQDMHEHNRTLTLHFTSQESKTFHAMHKCRIGEFQSFINHISLKIQTYCEGN